MRYIQQYEKLVNEHRETILNCLQKNDNISYDAFSDFHKFWSPDMESHVVRDNDLSLEYIQTRLYEEIEVREAFAGTDTEPQYFLEIV